MRSYFLSEMGLLHIVLVAFLACVAAGPAKFTRLDLYRNALAYSSRIVGGQNAARHQFPHQASLQVFGQHICGGTLIESRWVLTAGHCVDGDNTGLEIVLGLFNQGEEHEDVQRIRPARIIVHPEYPGGVAANDIAVIELESAAQTNKAVKIAALPISANCEIMIQGVVSGWGYTDSFNPEIPVALQWALLPIIPIEECKENLIEILDITGPLDNTMICSVGNENQFQSVCNGDSGGPLVIYSRGYSMVIGVVSWTVSPCGIFQKAPSVYTNVCSHIDFIQSYVR